MLRKRPITSIADGHRWLTAGWRTAGDGTSGAVIRTGRPDPVPHSTFASPRISFTIASLLHSTDLQPRIGATEPSPHATGAAHRFAGAREISILRPHREDADFNRACESPGRREPLQGGQAGKDAPDDGTDGSWGDVFVIEDDFEGSMSDSAEVVPHLFLAMGDDETHDIPRGSGAGAFAAPGVFLDAHRPKPRTSRDDESKKSHWLLGGGCWSGLGVRWQTRGERWN
jgi:hypothetical protein